MPLRNEYVRVISPKNSGSTARIKNYYANNLLVLVEVEGKFDPGDRILCTVSGEELVLGWNFQQTILAANNLYGDLKYAESPRIAVPPIPDYTTYTVEPYTDYGNEVPPWPVPDILTLLDNDSTAIDSGMGGPFIALDDHFTGNTLTQDYQLDYIITVRC